jgi:hypothetical protein
MNRLSHLLATASLLSAAFTLSACLEPDPLPEVRPPVMGIAGMRLVNASWDAPPLAVFIDGEQRGHVVRPGETWPVADRGTYTFVSSGDAVRVALVPDGGDEADALYARDMRFEPQRYYTLYTYGAARSDAEPLFGMHALKDDDCTGLVTCLRVINAATNLGPVDVWTWDGPPDGWRRASRFAGEGLPAPEVLRFAKDAVHALGVSPSLGEAPEHTFPFDAMLGPRDVFLFGDASDLKLLSVDGQQCESAPEFGSPDKVVPLPDGLPAVLLTP